MVVKSVLDKIPVANLIKADIYGKSGYLQVIDRCRNYNIRDNINFLNKPAMCE